MKLKTKQAWTGILFSLPALLGILLFYLIPYIISICSYLCLMHIFAATHMPHFLMAIVGISLLIQCTCIIINIWWKVSMHSAGAGGVIGALIAYSAIFGFNPIWWLSLAIFVAGCVMTSRMVLRQHTWAAPSSASFVASLEQYSCSPAPHLPPHHLQKKKKTEKNLPNPCSLSIKEVSMSIEAMCSRWT